MKHLNIGIVEDDLLIAESLVMALKQIGYHPILPVRSYHDALKMIEAESPELLILDITLEGKQDGIELGTKVNKDYGIPFIFLTAYSDVATIERAKKANPYAYLVKPFNENDLFSSIEIAFNNYNRAIKSVR
ncbi:MAG TPA: response regulator, partial [Chitinophagales bacterium]|nr:response regulator [Chitinophagales bacterium]